MFGHGFSRNRARYAGFGRHLASRGYVVIIPDFAGLADHSRNADDLSACVDWILAQDADASSIYQGGIDAGALGASSHSAGGMSALVALARDGWQHGKIRPTRVPGNAGPAVARVACVGCIPPGASAVDLSMMRSD